jgi:ubiquinone/menaquinone biosynthesis C-methylase UbiE
MFDEKFIFREINIKPGDYLLDLGCGIGEYSLLASDITGETGFVYAFDFHQSAIISLKNKIKTMGLNNIKAVITDITEPLPLEDRSIDICLIITVLHTLDIENSGDNLFKEISRILKPGGRLITIDCKKESSSFGPPLHMRISPKELENKAVKWGFEKLKLVDIGKFYMYQFFIYKK